MHQQQEEERAQFCEAQMIRKLIEKNHKIAYDKRIENLISKIPNAFPFQLQILLNF